MFSFLRRKSKTSVEKDGNKENKTASNAKPPVSSSSTTAAATTTYSTAGVGKSVNSSSAAARSSSILQGEKNNLFGGNINENKEAARVPVNESGVPISTHGHEEESMRLKQSRRISQTKFGTLTYNDYLKQQKQSKQSNTESSA